MQPLAQPPRKDDGRFDDWMYRLWQRINAAAGIAWSLVDKTGSNLTDLPTRNYKDLQNIPTPPVLAFSDGEDGESGFILLQPTSSGSANSVIDESDITIAANYTITTGKNGISVSPVTLADGVTVTIPTGSIWLIAS